jgi:ABC-type phosphate transport system substrate-binding protein
MSLAAILAMLALAEAAGPYALTVDGSSAAYPTVNAAAVQYVNSLPPGDTSISFFNSVEVGPNANPEIGSNAGISLLLDGQIDAATSARPLGAGDTGSQYSFTQIQSFPFAHDGVVIVVNGPSLGAVTNLTRQDLADVYNCVYTDWHQLVPSIPAGTTIVPVARGLPSGERTLLLADLRSYILPWQETACISSIPNDPRAIGDADMAGIVANTPNSIGYLSLGAINWPALQKVSVEGIPANADTIMSNTYPFAHLVYAMVPEYSVNQQVVQYGDGQYARTMDLINYLVGSSGQADVATSGLVPLQSVQQIPDWDVNVDNITNILDVSLVGQHWLQTGRNHWIREDVTRIGTVDIAAIGTIGQHWLQTWSVWTQ